jgi:hypothetical protein
MPTKSHEDGRTLGEQPSDTQVRQDSDRLFEELNALKRLETEKQRTLPTTPPFHHIAERVDRQATAVVNAARDELEHGQDAAEEHDRDRRSRMGGDGRARTTGSDRKPDGRSRDQNRPS